MSRTSTVAQPVSEATVISGTALPARRRRWGWLTQRNRLPQKPPVELEAEAVDSPSRRAFPWRRLSFATCVFMPFLASIYYYGWVASSQYEAEARFVVRAVSGGEIAANDDEEESGRGIMTMSALSQDAYVVTSFIHSSELLERLEEKVDWNAVYGAESIDPLSRLDPDGGAEERLDYWKGKATTFVDGPSGIVTLRVRAFDPEDARLIANAVTTESEALVNELSIRARNDRVEMARGEVEKAAARYGNALSALNAYQNSSGILEPVATAGVTRELLTGLTARLLETNGRLNVIERSGSTNSPAFRQLQILRESLAEQIEELEATLVSEKEDRTISNALVDFAKLETERLLSERLYEVAVKNLENVERAALQQAAYVAPFASPLVADDPRYPKRIVTPLLILLGLFVAWATVLLAVATVEDHRS